jgi:predicted DNA binding CopG/RHH family protein
MSHKKYKLDEDEQEILDALQKGELSPLKDSEKEIQKLETSAKAYGNKVHRVNIRLTDWDFEKTQEIALQEGIPPTTLISSIVHKFLSGRLVERYPNRR